MIEHDLEFVKNYAEHVAFVNEGGMDAEGLPGQILAKEEVKKVLSGY